MVRSTLSHLFFLAGPKGKIQLSTFVWLCVPSLWKISVANCKIWRNLNSSACFASEPRVYCTKYISKSYQKMKHASNCSELICKHVYILTRLRSDEHYIIRWQVTCCKFRSCLVYETPLKYKSKHTNMKHFSIVLSVWYFQDVQMMF